MVICICTRFEIDNDFEDRNEAEQTGIGHKYLVFSIIMVFQAAASDIRQHANGVQSTTLENGLEIVVIPDRRAPVVTHMLWYRVGSADEPIGKSGIAHFLEHMLFKATENYPAGEFSSKIAAIGGQENAFTSCGLYGLFSKSCAFCLRRYDAL